MVALALAAFDIGLALLGSMLSWQTAETEPSFLNPFHLFFQRLPIKCLAFINLIASTFMEGTVLLLAWRHVVSGGIGNQTKSLCSFQHFTVVDWIYSRSYCSQFTRLALSNLTSRFLNVRDTTKPIKS